MPYDIRRPYFDGDLKTQVKQLEDAVIRLTQELNTALNTIEEETKKIKKEENDGK